MLQYFKKIKSLHIIIFFVCLLFSSCYKEIEIHLEHESLLTVNSWIIEGKPIDIYLSESRIMYDTLVPLEQNATAVIKNKNISDTLINMGKGHFRSRSITARESEIYNLEVKTDGLPAVTACDTLPKSTNFKIVNFIPEAKQDEWGDVYSEFEIEIKDSPGIKNYYEIAAISYSENEYTDSLGNPYIHKNTDFAYITSNDAYIINEGDQDFYPLTVLLSDELFDGKSIRIKCYVYYNIGYDKAWYILFRNISQTYYRYKKKLLRHSENQYHDFWDGTGNPVQLYSNIENGYGVFAGFCEQRDTIIIADWQ